MKSVFTFVLAFMIATAISASPLPGCLAGSVPARNCPCHHTSAAGMDWALAGCENECLVSATPAVAVNPQGGYQHDFGNAPDAARTGRIELSRGLSGVTSYFGSPAVRLSIRFHILLI